MEFQFNISKCFLMNWNINVSQLRWFPRIPNHNEIGVVEGRTIREIFNIVIFLRVRLTTIQENHLYFTITNLDHMNLMICKMSSEFLLELEYGTNDSGIFYHCVGEDVIFSNFIRYASVRSSSHIFP